MQVKEDILPNENEDDEGTNFEDEIEEIIRLGKEEKLARPMSVTLKSQATIEEILTRTYMLKCDGEYKKKS